MRVYVGSSLTSAPVGYDALVASLVANVRERGCEVLEYLGKERGVPGDVFRHDTKHVLASDLFVALCDYPSTGLGYEICLSLTSSIPVLAFARRGVPVSRLIQGIDNPLFQFKRYESLSCIIDEFDRVVPLLRVNRQPVLL